MVLVDTSVWIRYLYDRTPEAAELQRLLFLDQVIGHALVYGELLMGAPGGRKGLLAEYEQMPQAEIIPHAEVVEFVRTRGLHGRGVGWIDVHILASAVVARLPVWTADPRFGALATELGVNYEIRR